MRLHALLIAALFLGATIAKSDHPVEPKPLVFTPDYSGEVCFCMVPQQWSDSGDKVVRESFGILYRLTDEGSLVQVYRTDGWYSSKVYVSKDGRYLVRMGPWTSGLEVSEQHLAVAFYKDGKLRKQYSTSDLVKDPNQLEYTSSHYRWMAPGLRQQLTDAEREALWPKLDYQNKFTLNTLDGWTYVFDATTGDLVSSAKTKD